MFKKMVGKNEKGIKLVFDPKFVNFLTDLIIQLRYVVKITIVYIDIANLENE